MKIDKAQVKLFLKFLKYLLPYRKKQITILILTGLGVLLGLINPYLSKLVVDKAIINKDAGTFVLLGLIGSGVFILNGLVKACAGLLRRGMRLRVKFDLNKRIFAHLQGLPLVFFRDKSTGEHMFGINYDIERTTDLVIAVPEEFVNIFPKLFLTLAVIFYLDWQMAVFALVLAPILYLPIYYFTRKMRKVWEELIADSQNIFQRLNEVFSHIYLVKAFGRERQEIRRYLRALLGNIRIQLRNVRLEIFSNFAGGSSSRLIIGMITLFGGFQVIRGRITAGALAAIMIYLAQLIALQGGVGSFFQRIVFGLISCRRLDEVLQQHPEQAEPPRRSRNMIFKHPCIEFQGVYFGYRRGEYILRDINFSVEEGMVALVGPSGCGKSTILNLLLKLYAPRQGAIIIGDYNIKELSSAALRSRIGVALQEPFLWNDTVENNIRYARAEAKRQEVVRAARMAGADEFVRDLPRGYETVIGEDACRISEGQKQKIAVARALIKKPKILLLDEAMSSMDSQSEERIIDEIERSDIPLTIVVSHRLSTVRACGLVYFLKGADRMFVEKPDVLIQQDRQFCELFAGQVREEGASLLRASQ